MLPLDNTKVERLDVQNRPSNIRGLKEFTYYDGMVRIPEGGAPDLKNKSFGISAVVEIPDGGAEGLLMTQGGRFAGVGLDPLDGRPVFHYNLAGVERYTVAGKEKVAPGRHVVTLDFKELRRWRGQRRSGDTHRGRGESYQREPAADDRLP